MCEEDMRDDGGGWLVSVCYIVMVFFAVMFSLFLLTGCKTQYVETVRTEYVNKTDTFIQRDSVCYKDSVWVERRGDTITLQKTKIVYRDRWRERVVCDTVIRSDSISVPYPVEGKVKVWEKVELVSVGLVGGGVLVLGVMWWIRRRYKRF